MVMINMSEEIFDITVIGAGPGGYHTAIRAAQYGAKVALIEKKKLGGTCLNWGCIPTKALYASSLMIEEIEEKAKDFGIEISGEIKTNFSQAVDRKNKVVEELVGGIGALLKQRKVTVYMGTGSIIGGSDLNYQVKIEGQDNATIKTKKIIIATGSTPALIPAFNIDHKRILTSDDILDYDFKNVPKRLLVIGAGVIGCEFANIFTRFGSKVIMLEFLPTMIATEETLIIRELKKKFDEMGIELHVNQNVLKVENTGSGVKATTCDASVPRDQVDSAEKSSFEADICLVSIGRAKVSDGLGLDNLGIKTERGQIIVNKDTLETDAKGIYAIGDVTGGLMLAHVASYEGDIAVVNALTAIGGFGTKEEKPEYNVVPASIFTSPEIGSVGLREKVVKEKGIKPWVGRFAFASLGKAKCMGADTGFMMVIGDPETDKILGASCIGHSAPELIAEISLAMRNGLTCHDVVKTIHSHPTISEMVLESVEDVHGMAIHKAGRRRTK
ncbi:MAG: dihydrolipoyl dehydrogenase [Candidatus Lokiarchaeota archaeon]|nr:dihydrolipoyl dehydrogenase [Candidatus Lokiarchaeota archaeon]